MKEQGRVEQLFDRFAVDYWLDNIILEEKFFPAGFIACETLNISNEIIDKLAVPSVVLQELINEISLRQHCDKNMIETIQKAVNIMNQIIYTLPLYSKLDLDKETHETVLLKLDETDISKLSFHTSEEYVNVKTYINNYISVPHQIVNFGHMIKNLEHNVLQKLAKRDTDNYAQACTKFFANEKFIMTLLSQSPDPNIGQFDPIAVSESSCAVRLHPESKDRYIFIDRIYFNNMMSFLVMDLLKGLQHGHAPKKCKNCGRYFLNETGYDTKYCDRVSPQKPDRTCKQIGSKELGKEKLEDDPVWHSYENARKRIDADFRRKNITMDQSVIAKNEIKRLRNKCIKGGLTYKELDMALQSKTLYKKLGFEAYQ